MSEQVERAYQKQQMLTQGRKRILAQTTGKGLKAKGMRFWKNVGIGIKTPREAIYGTYIDKKCPFTSTVSIRGRILTGVVKSAAMTRNVVVRRDYLHYVPKYRRYEKRHTNIPAHCSPAFPHIKEGDRVTIGECRPLSKTVRFNVLKVENLAKRTIKQAKRATKPRPKKFKKF
jgi:small subunit ribosomal protein S11e